MERNILLLLGIGLLVYPSCAYLPESLEDGLVGYWRMENNTQDYRGLHNGTLAGSPSYTSEGKLGGAYEFNGVDDYIDISDAANTLNSLSEGSISAWFKFNNPSLDDFRPIIYLGTDSQSVSDSVIVEVGHLGMDPLKNAYFTITPAASTDPIWCYDFNQDLSTGEWYHFVAVVNSSGNTGYLNGIEVTDRDYNFGTSSSTEFFDDITDADLFTIGYGMFVANYQFYYFNGTIDEVGVWNRSLSSSEVSQLYSMTTSTTTTSTISTSTSTTTSTISTSTSTTTSTTTTIAATVVINSTYTSSPPTIDGVLSPGEWGNSLEITLNGYNNPGQTLDGQLYVLNCESTIYVAVVIQDSSATTSDWAMVDFDQGNDHTATLGGEDAMDYYYGAYSDYYWDGQWWASDVTGGGTSHGSGSRTHSGGEYTYEFSKPLNSGEGKDMSLAPGDVVGFRIELWDESTFDNYRFPQNTVDAVTSRWDEWADLYIATSTTTTSTTTTSTTTTTIAASTTTTTTLEGECTLVGDYPPCGVVELSEVIDLINTWAAEHAELSDVIDLINAWASG